MTLRSFLTIALLLVLPSAACNSSSEVRFDFDGDGSEDAVDCDPADSTVHPGADDQADDGRDNNCDGVDGIDHDQDSHASVSSGGEDCNDADPTIFPGAFDPQADPVDSDCDGHPGTDSDGDGVASLLSGGLDCDDLDAAIHPGAEDPFDDLVDSDCDGHPGTDSDGDGHASSESGGGDCNDANIAVHPGALDLLGDELDSDCDGHDGTDEDSDGFASLFSGGTDCDDLDAAVHPDAQDTPDDGIDNDCDGVQQEDADGDSWLSGVDDCNDADALVHPDAPELLDGVDNNCNDLVDEGTAAFDDDGDGSCEGVDLDSNGTLDCLGTAVAGDCDDSDPTQNIQDLDNDSFTTCAGDCDDLSGTIYPNSIELCDGVDNNCDGSVPAAESDGDGDGIWGCMGDCDDTDASINPIDFDGDNYSTCNNPPDCNDAGWDSNLDGIPDGFTTYPGAPDDVDGAGTDSNCDGVDGTDLDGDGVASINSGGTDCNDNPNDPNAPAIYPTATDTVSNAIDNNCDGIPGVDDDQDGYPSIPSGGDDCDDSAAVTYPDAPEQCDSADNDCDCTGDSNGDGVACGVGDDGVDEGTAEDDDGDGELACQGDCDNQDPTVYSTAPELCDGIDNDCDPATTAVGGEQDSDNDGTPACADCPDSDPARSILAAELCDGIDNDCDCPGDTNGDGSVCLTGDDGVDESCLSCDVLLNPGVPDAIQDAVDAAAQGTVLCLTPGTYNESIETSVSLSLVGTHGRAQTSIDAQGTGTVLLTGFNMPGVTLLQGLTLTGGDGEVGSPTGSNQAGGAHLRSDTTIESVIIEDNTADWSGGMHAYSSVIDATDLIIRNNEVTYDGGGVRAEQMSGTWQNVLVEGNVANRSAGGMKLMFGALSANSLVIRNNLSGAGGGILLAAATLALEDLVMLDNRAEYSPESTTPSAGGLWIGIGSTVSIDGALIRGNISTGGSSTGGGGIYQQAGSLSLSDVRLEENEAFNGAGILQTGGTLTISDSVIARNQANSPNVGGGGGLYLSGGDTHLTRVQVLDNQASGSQTWGGGLYSQNWLTVSQSTFSGNHARRGGGVAISTSLPSSQLSHVQILGNTAVEGGGVFLAYQASVSFDHGRIADNSAVLFGGGLYINNTEPTELSYLSVLGNSAQQGGGIYVADVTGFNSSSNIVMTGVDISYNSVTTNGAGLYNAIPSYDPDLDSCNLWENSHASTGVLNNVFGFSTSPVGSNGNLSADPEYLGIAAGGLSNPVDWDLHLGPGSALVDAGPSSTLEDSPADIGMFGGGAQWDLDGDGYPLWWQPGAYDSSTYPPAGWDCDDSDATVFPGSGC